MLNDTGELLLNGFIIQIVLWEVGKPCIVEQTWDLIPVRVEGVSAPLRPSPETPSPDPLLSYDGKTAGQSSTSAQHAESEHDDFGTIVTEVTTTVITTRKKYRVEDTY